MQGARPRDRDLASNDFVVAVLSVNKTKRKCKQSAARYVWAVCVGLTNEYPVVDGEWSVKAGSGCRTWTMEHGKSKLCIRNVCVICDFMCIENHFIE